jgi:hypothetical protein
MNAHIITLPVYAQSKKVRRQNCNFGIRPGASDQQELNAVISVWQFFKFIVL